jgi:hypothetical protein
MLSRRLFLTLPSLALAQDKSPRLSYLSLGPIRIGMTEPQVRAAFQAPMVSDKAEMEGYNCYYLGAKSQKPLDRELGFMMIDNRLARIDVFRGPWKTVSGAGIGTTEEELKTLYAGLYTFEKHQYEDPGRYYTIRSKDPLYKPYAVVFETDGKKVTTFRAGLATAVALIEGCV